MVGSVGDAIIIAVDDDAGDDDDEQEEEEEIIIETITVPNPTLLSTAQNQLRAHRLNLHEIDVLDQNMAELTTGLNKLNINLKEWKEMYPEYDFEMLEGEEGEIVVSSSGIVKQLGGGVGGERKEEGGNGDDDGDEMAKTLVLEEISSSDVSVLYVKSFLICQDQFRLQCNSMYLILFLQNYTCVYYYTGCHLLQILLLSTLQSHKKIIPTS